MGLTLQVGRLAGALQDANDDDAQVVYGELELLNRLLAAHGLEAHTEPEVCPEYSATMVGYSGLHYLRRAAAHLELRDVFPDPGGEDAPDDPVLEEYYELHFGGGGSGGFDVGAFLGRLFGRRKAEAPTSPTAPAEADSRAYDHLIFHGDSEGYYVPVELTGVLFADEKMGIPGDMVGSSQALLRETQVLARALELPLEMDLQTGELWEAAHNQGRGKLKWQRYGVESLSCFNLHHAARHSIQHGALLHFV